MPPSLPFHLTGHVVLALTLLLGGCRYPQDMDDSLNTVQSGALHVGVTENAPWVIGQKGTPTGLEPQLIKELASRWNTTVHWHWGTESELLEALGSNQIHLALGGFSQSPHLRKRAALTKPYFVSEQRVGFPTEAVIPQDLTAVHVGIRRLQALSGPLEQRHAYPAFIDQFRDQDLPVATDDWRLEAYRRFPGPWVLRTDKHVMALPKGENGWMMEVQRYLNGLKPESIRQRLVTLEREHAP